MVPGVQVAQINSSGWAISVRGFSSSLANKLLVLIDGRKVYDPLFSGVYWDIQDLVLEDIERIEVIRGPGGSLWGANAMNGVINIITKKAGDTQGNLLSLSAGNQNRGIGEEDTATNSATTAITACTENISTGPIRKRRRTPTRATGKWPSAAAFAPTGKTRRPRRTILRFRATPITATTVI